MPRLSQGFCPVVVCLACAWFMTAIPVQAQQRPILTEDPDPIGDGKMLIEAGVDHTWTQRFPVSGLEGNLLRGPLLGISTGIGPSVELQVDDLSWSRLAIHERFEAPLSWIVKSGPDSTSSVEDVVVATKIRLVRETGARPSFGFRFATRLPLGGNEKGIGLDTMSFFQSLLVGKSLRTTRVVGNFGYAILSNPIVATRQNDVLTYGLSLVHGLRTFAIVADINGWLSTRRGTPPPGTETRSTATFGLRYPLGRVRFDGGYFIGVTASDERSGVKGGITWAFNSFLGE